MSVRTYLRLRLSLAIDVHQNAQTHQMVFQGWKAQQWGSPTLGSPNRDKYESSSSSCSTRHEVEGPQAAPSFSASAQTTVPHVRSHRTRSIQRYHPHCNELAIPDRATAKRTRKTSKLSQLHATNFARICIEVHVQVLRDRAVAKLAKRLSRWRTPVIQDGAEFCIWWIAEDLEVQSSTLLINLSLSLFSRFIAFRTLYKSVQWKVFEIQHWRLKLRPPLPPDKDSYIDSQWLGEWARYSDGLLTARDSVIQNECLHMWDSLSDSSLGANTRCKKNPATSGNQHWEERKKHMNIGVRRCQALWWKPLSLQPNKQTRKWPTDVQRAVSHGSEMLSRLWWNKRRALRIVHLLKEALVVSADMEMLTRRACALIVPTL